MHKILAIIRALIKGDASIESVNKIPIMKNELGIQPAHN